MRYSISKAAVAQHFSAASASIETDGDHAFVVTAGGDDPERMVLYFAMLGAAFEVLEPPEVIDAARAVSARLQRAASPSR